MSPKSARSTLLLFDVLVLSRPVWTGHLSRFRV